MHWPSLRQRGAGSSRQGCSGREQEGPEGQQALPRQPRVRPALSHIPAPAASTALVSQSVLTAQQHAAVLGGPPVGAYVRWIALFMNSAIYLTHCTYWRAAAAVYC